MTQPSDIEMIGGPMVAGRPPVARVAARVLQRQIDWLQVGSKLLRLPIDPRTVHDMRVAARRSRIALRLLTRLLGQERTALLASELRWIAELLGETRDWDIVIGRVQQRSEDPAARLAPDQAAQRTALGALAKARADAHARLVDGLASSRYAELVQSLVATAQDLERNGGEGADGDRIADLAAKRVACARKRVRSCLHDDVEALDVRRLHRVRIRVRRLRYLVELLADFEGTPFADLAMRLAAAQDALGAAQDAIVAERLLDLLARRTAAGEDGDGELETILVRFRRDEHRRARRARSKLLRTWRRLPKTLRMLKRALRE
jgi:CHAD domain-containing protein